MFFEKGLLMNITYISFVTLLKGSYLFLRENSFRSVTTTTGSIFHLTRNTCIRAYDVHYPCTR